MAASVLIFPYLIITYYNLPGYILLIAYKRLLEDIWFVLLI